MGGHGGRAYESDCEILASFFLFSIASWLMILIIHLVPLHNPTETNKWGQYIIR